MLVHSEEFPQVTSAIAREKEIKGWRREKKLKLIIAGNPD
jgi:putative endonuclease